MSQRFTMNSQAAAAGLILAGLVLPVCLAGDLEPPGPPAPTMKTLDEVEPRIPIHVDDLPLTISAPGSYYLAEDVSAATGGITIDASQVTIDLMGHRLDGTGASLDGISANSGRSHIEVRNGIVSGWGQHGIRLELAPYSKVIDVRVEDTGSLGGNPSALSVGDHGLVARCIVSNSAEDGISAGDNASVIGCKVAASGETGINIGTNGLVLDSTADGSGLHGVFASSNSQVIRCSCTNSGADGIRLVGGVVRDCLVAGNGANGIGVVGSSTATVEGNVCRNNTAAGISFGFVLKGRIEGNEVAENATGIDVAGSGKVVIRNSARGNTVEYNIAAGNDVGPIGSAATATSPWANIDF